SKKEIAYPGHGGKNGRKLCSDRTRSEKTDQQGQSQRGLQKALRGYPGQPWKRDGEIARPHKCHGKIGKKKCLQKVQRRLHHLRKSPNDEKREWDQQTHHWNGQKRREQRKCGPVKKTKKGETGCQTKTPNEGDPFYSAVRPDRAANGRPS